MKRLSFMKMFWLSPVPAAEPVLFTSGTHIDFVLKHLEMFGMSNDKGYPRRAKQSEIAAMFPILQKGWIRGSYQPGLMAFQTYAVNNDTLGRLQDYLMTVNYYNEKDQFLWADALEQRFIETTIGEALTASGVGDFRRRGEKMGSEIKVGDKKDTVAAWWTFEILSLDIPGRIQKLIEMGYGNSVRDILSVIPGIGEGEIKYYEKKMEVPKGPKKEPMLLDKDKKDDRSFFKKWDDVIKNMDLGSQKPDWEEEKEGTKKDDVLKSYIEMGEGFERLYPQNPDIDDPEDVNPDPLGYEYYENNMEMDEGTQKLLDEEDDEYWGREKKESKEKTAMKEYVKLNKDVVSPYSGQEGSKGEVGDVIVYDGKRDLYVARFPADDPKSTRTLSLMRTDFDYVESARGGKKGTMKEVFVVDERGDGDQVLVGVYENEHAANDYAMVRSDPEISGNEAIVRKVTDPEMISDYIELIELMNLATDMKKEPVKRIGEKLPPRPEYGSLGKNPWECDCGFEHPESVLVSPCCSMKNHHLNKEEKVKRLSKEQEPIEKQVADFLKDNPDPSDTQIHNLAEELNMEPDDLEEIVYSMLTSFVSGEEKIPGGKADGLDESEFPEKAIEMGERVEMEHTNDPEVAREITKDHLVESPEYYEYLDKMEEEMKGKGSRTAAVRFRTVPQESKSNKKKIAIMDGFEIGYLEGRYDFVKAKQTDRLRTKMAWRWSYYIDVKKLSEVLGVDVEREAKWLKEKDKKPDVIYIRQQDFGFPTEIHARDLFVGEVNSAIDQASKIQLKPEKEPMILQEPVVEVQETVEEVTGTPLPDYEVHEGREKIVDWIWEKAKKALGVDAAEKEIRAEYNRLINKMRETPDGLYARKKRALSEYWVMSKDNMSPVTGPKNEESIWAQDAKKAVEQAILRWALPGSKENYVARAVPVKNIGFASKKVSFAEGQWAKSPIGDVVILEMDEDIALVYSYDGDTTHEFPVSKLEPSERTGRPKYFKRRAKEIQEEVDQYKKWLETLSEDQITAMLDSKAGELQNTVNKIKAMEIEIDKMQNEHKKHLAFFSYASNKLGKELIETENYITKIKKWAQSKSVSWKAATTWLMDRVEDDLRKQAEDLAKSMKEVETRTRVDVIPKETKEVSADEHYARCYIRDEIQNKTARKEIWSGLKRNYSDVLSAERLHELLSEYYSKKGESAIDKARKYVKDLWDTTMNIVSSLSEHNKEFAMLMAKE